PGFGDSGKPRKILKVPELADWLAAWAAIIGIERASMLGNSFGCQVIADLAMRYPQRIERAIL
ncbi:MAG TPA: alpha/beta hydrolase, partial [Terriglobales bacterium]|nr:alpha/beta hydrolase [Terriglobales bacterium]